MQIVATGFADDNMRAFYHKGFPLSAHYTYAHIHSQVDMSFLQ